MAHAPQVTVLETRREAHLNTCRCAGRLPRAAPAAAAAGARAPADGGPSPPAAAQAPGPCGELLALFKCSAGLDLSPGQRVRILAPWRALPAPRLGPAGLGPGPPVVFVQRAELAVD